MDLIFNKYIIDGFIKEAFSRNEISGHEVLDTVMGKNKVLNTSRMQNEEAEPRINLRRKSARFGGGQTHTDEYGKQSGNNSVGDQSYVTETSN